AGSGNRQLRFLHVQPRAVSRGARSRGPSPAQRRALARGDPRAPPGPDSHLARPVYPERGRDLARGHREGPRRGPGARRLPRPPGHRSGLRRKGRARGARTRQDREDNARRRGGVQGSAAGLRGDPLSLARHRAGLGARVPHRNQPDRGWRDHGREAQGAARRGRPVSPRERPDTERQRVAQELPGGL
ncbi:MAG: Anthranilate synthase, amidotransferase component @ Para-aminobenzoate synthase, amidotransferase component, partial [uncultured Rubrobacteraceae bacterium]